MTAANPSVRIYVGVDRESVLRTVAVNYGKVLVGSCVAYIEMEVLREKVSELPSPVAPCNGVAFTPEAEYQVSSINPFAGLVMMVSEALENCYYACQGV